jgi:hypothetical protein
MDALLNVMTWFFLLSGVVSWVVVISLTFYYWLCQPKKGK